MTDQRGRVKTTPILQYVNQSVEEPKKNQVLQNKRFHETYRGTNKKTRASAMLLISVGEEWLQRNKNTIITVVVLARTLQI